MRSSLIKGRAVQQHIAWLAAVVLTLSYVISAFLYQPVSVYADQVTSRSIDISTSEEGATASYDISFSVPDTGTEDIGSFRVEFCNGDPLPGTTCSFTSGDNIPDLDSATLGSAAFDDTSGNDECTTVSMEAVTAGDRHLDFTCDAVDDIGGTGNFTATVNSIVNPTNDTESPANPNNTFYARLYVYTTTTPTAIANPVTGYVHSGGAAMSTAEQLTVTARVAEVLEFCVGTNETAPAECSGMSGNSVDLGVLDFASVNRSSTETPASQGSIMVRTNASGGVTVGYFAEQDNGDGKLKVNGTACTDNVSTADQCINSVGTTQSEISAGTEEFGLCVFNIDTTSSTGGTSTTNVTADTEYDGLCDNSAGNGYAFDDTGTFDQIADSTTSGGNVVNDEMLELDFAGTTDIATPSGLYSTTLTFIGTSTF